MAILVIGSWLRTDTGWLAMYVLYTMLSVLIGVCLLPRLLWRCVQGAGYHRDLRERFGGGAAWRSAIQHAQVGMMGTMLQSRLR